MTLTLGGAGIEPGRYRGQLAFLVDDPRPRRHAVEVSLEVVP